MKSTDLDLLPAGSLNRPGIIGRSLRLLLGGLCVYYVYLLSVTSIQNAASEGIPSTIWNGILPSLFLISYVVNIGFSVSLKKLPLFASLAIILVLAVIGFLRYDTVETNLLAGFLKGWQIYLYLHLGVSFILSSILATPGCEMRALHDLYAKIRGASAMEHRCPVGPISLVDRWETSFYASK